MPESAGARHFGEPLRNAQSSAEQLDGDDAQMFRAVRTLLMSEEQEGIADLHHRLVEIERSTFDRDRKRDEVAEVLADALRQATLRDGDKIDAVIAPVIGEGIRNQLRDERPAMVAALVPMVGTLVTGAVGDAIGRISTRINEKFDKLLSFEGLKLALRARLTGSSIHDVLMAELRKTEVERLYLFERRGDRLVFCWPGPEEGEALSGGVADEILHAVFAFSGGILGSGEHGLRSLTVKDRHLVVQGSDTHVVVIEVSGPLSDRRCGDLTDACFEVLTFVSDLTGDLEDVEIDAEAMALFAARIVRSEAGEEAARRRVSPAFCVAAAVALLLLGYLGWNAYQRHALDRRADSVEAFIASRFADDALMLSVRADHDAGAVGVLGVAFADGDRAAIRERAVELARPYTLDFDFVNNAPGVGASRVGVVETGLDTLRAEADRTRVALGGVDARAAQANAKADALWSARRQLADWVDGNAVFFGIGTAYRPSDTLSGDLDTLAALMLRAPDRPLRIVGYSDMTGPERDNARVATQRAERVAGELVARGVPADRLIVLARIGRDSLISTRTGAGSPNRRVEFALGFVGERP